ncbi:hypothetical protein J2809_003956 [Arthrobacter pascens]|uniref:FG-GAP-like repeat-containing protein n=1 Tax=Arthrobacter pascens TaxID=1677 RepID=UPI00286492F0|nr:M57 family metalloprotease [Arthrobacter pascens]MDR6559576.1 hypothetical protein [Arthrobacter pascens]
MRSFSRSTAAATGLLVFAAGLVSLPVSPTFAASTDNATDHAADAPATQLVPGTPHGEHMYESAPGVPMDTPPTGSALQAEAGVLASAPMKIKLVTAKLADNKNAVSMTAADQAIVATSNYWKAMSNGRISMTVTSRLAGHQSAATSSMSYYDLINKITSELKWTYSTNTALVVFIPTSTLSYGALGAGFSSNGNSGRVLMPQINTTFTKSVLTHEFGHVLGAMHADALQCGSGVNDVGTTSTGQFKDSSCYIREYGDTTDLMGASRYSMPVVSSPFWDSRGLGRGDEVRDLGIATGIKSYTLRPWGGTLANRALKFTDPISRETYYLELRQPVGYDSYLSSDYAGNRGVKIVQRGGATPVSSLTLMPSTIPFSGYYSANHAWQAGRTFTTHAGTTVTINAVTADYATVTINADPALRAKIQFSAGDFNGDGRADVLSRESDGSLMLLAGQAGNKLGAPVRFAGGWNIFNTVVGDVDFTGDGIPDIFGRTSAGEFWLYPGNGKGGFLPRIRIGGGWQIFQRIVAPGDLTGDGKADLAGIKFDGTLWVYPGNGKDGLLLPSNAGSGWAAFSAVAPASGFSAPARGGLFARSQTGSLYFYPGNGAGGFLAPTNLGSGWGSFKDLIGGQDFTGDGQKDLLATTATGPAALYPGNETGRFATRVTVPGTDWDEFRQVWEAGDATGDGRADIFALTPQGTLWLHPGNGSGGFQAARQLNSGWQTYDQIFSAGNFDGTGGLDLIARDAAGVLWVYPTDGRGTMLPRKLLGRSLTGFSRFLSPGDFTGDGKSDLLAQSEDGQLWLYPGNGVGGLQTRKPLGYGWNVFNQIVSADDFTGDGRNDLMASTTDGKLWLYPGNGGGGFLARKQLGSAWNIYKSIANVGRFAGTASPGLIATAPDGKLWLYAGNRQGGFQASVLNPR